MFERYILDASILMERSAESDIEIAYLRSSIFHIASAVEAYVDDIAVLADAQKTIYTETERDFLNDRKWILKTSKASVEQGDSNNSIHEKLRYLARKHPRDGFDILGDSVWQNFQDFKSFRNRLIHPKQSTEDISVEDYRSAANNGLITVVKLLNLFSQCIFRKQLRPRLLELIE